MDTISVIIPAYNAEAWIRTCLDSVLGQSLRDIEVIVVDDGSSDATSQIAESLKDSRLKVFRQENCGQSAAINAGVRVSTGKYLKIVDADDWINPDHLAGHLQSLEGTTDAVSACGWGYFVERPAETARRHEQADRDYEDPLEWLVDSLTLDEGMMGGWKWLIPRQVWERSGGYDERLSLNNDFDFSIRLLLASQGVRYASGACYAYRKGVAGAMSGTNGRKGMESAFGTTESGCRALLAREDSPRIRKICADRWQQWLHRFYPEFPDLVSRAQAQINSLGGSALPMPGGRLQQMLLPFVGWKAVRRAQVLVYRSGWGAVLRWKARRRVELLDCSQSQVVSR
jgi:glycosyltransferase involved in cell wall biosynthesis